MPKRKPDLELLAAIREHAVSGHRLDLTDAEIAYEGRARPAGTKVLFRPGSELEPAWFRCLLCEPGFDRYRADLYAGEPPAWALTRIREHFAATHGIPELPLGRIFVEGGDRGRAVCDWQPATERTGAGFYCYLCAENERHRYLEIAPYGDARRLHEVLRWHPQLRSQTRGLSSEQVADEVELFDRGLTAAARRKSARRVLAEARGHEHRQPPTPVIQAWRRLLLDEVAAGKSATEAVAALVKLQERDPIGFRCRIGEQLPDMEATLERVRDVKEFAELVVALHGYPERSGRTIWNIWRGIPREQRAQAEAASRH